MFDRRILNTGYSLRPIRLFMATAALMDEEDLAPSPPWVCPDGITIRQTFGSCPAQVGCDIYFRMSACGEFVLIYDPEEADFDDQGYPDEVWEWKDDQSTSKLPYSDGLAASIQNYIANF